MKKASRIFTTKACGLLVVIVMLSKACSDGHIDLTANKEHFETKGEILYFKGDPFTGTGVYTYDNGQIQTELPYNKGVLDGARRDFDREGKLLVERSYLSGKKNGVWCEYKTETGDDWQIDFPDSAYYFKTITYAEGKIASRSRVFYCKDSTLAKDFQEYERGDGEIVVVDTLYEYNNKGNVSAWSYYPDTSNEYTDAIVYFDNGNVHRKVKKHLNVIANTLRKWNALEDATKEFNLDIDLSDYLSSDSVALKIISYQEYNDKGRLTKNIKGTAELDKVYAELQQLLPLLRLQKQIDALNGYTSSVQQRSYSSSSRSSKAKACYTCNREFTFKEWKGKSHGWANFKEKRPGYVKCNMCDGYGFTDEYHPTNYSNPTTRTRCTNRSCQNGWVQCRTCYGKG